MAARLRFSFGCAGRRLRDERSSAGHLWCAWQMDSPTLSRNAAGVFSARKSCRSNGLSCAGTGGKSRPSPYRTPHTILSAIATRGCRGARAGVRDASTNARSGIFSRRVRRLDRGRETASCPGIDRMRRTLNRSRMPASVLACPVSSPLMGEECCGDVTTGIGHSAKMPMAEK